MRATRSGKLQTRIRPEALNPALDLRGLDADRVLALLRGQARPADWAAGLQIDIDNPSAKARDDIQRQEIELPDGRVCMQPGGASRLRVTDTHRRENTLLPQSLHLALAQQWARSGVMMMHAACFTFADSATLVVGRKAAGKSILSIAALAAGGTVISDDWLLVGLDHEGCPKAERLREFLMLREGWAGTRLRELLADLPTRNAGTRPKRTIALDRVPAAMQSRFPSAVSIDRIWHLRRPRAGRGQTTTSTKLPRQQALASIIESTMPLLYSANFPEERRCLMQTAARLTERTHLETVETGTDLIEDPRTTLKRLHL